MTRDEVSLLWDEYHRNPVRENRNPLVEAYLPLAAKLARRFTGRGLDDEDLFQVSSLALVRAVEQYRPETGVRFVSYAIPVLEGAIRHELRDHGHAIRLPEGQLERQRAILRESESFEREHFRPATPQELAEKLGISPADVLLLTSLRTVSLDTDPSEEEGSLKDWLGAADPAYEHFENRDWLNTILEKLEETEKQLIRFRYVQDLSQRDTARNMGISQMQVSRLERRLLLKLKSMETEGA